MGPAGIALQQTRRARKLNELTCQSSEIVSAPEIAPGSDTDQWIQANDSRSSPGADAPRYRSATQNPLPGVRETDTTSMAQMLCDGN